MANAYDWIGSSYRTHRQADPRIEAQIMDALGDARAILNVGAGSGSYEPHDRDVVAVEPSAVMIEQRVLGSAPVACASAVQLPFGDDAFDASMAILTLHHWPDRDIGLAEMKRVSRSRCIVLTWEPPPAPFWLTADYLPHFLEADRLLFPPWFRDDPEVREVREVPIPHDCSDGFLCAYWRRPEAYLDPAVRGAISTFARLGGYDAGLAKLARDLEDGSWHRRNAPLLAEESLDLGYRLVVLGKK